MADVAAAATSATRFRTLLLSAFATVAAFLAMLGLGGMVAFHVSERRRELGLRSALGATRAQVVGMLVGQGTKHAAVGALMGVMVAAMGGRWLGHLLFGVGPLDPIVFGSVPLAFVALAALVAFVPAWAASRREPSGALRVD